MLDRKFLDGLPRSSDIDIDTDMNIEIFSMRNCATANTTNGTMLRTTAFANLHSKSGLTRPRYSGIRKPTFNKRVCPTISLRFMEKQRISR
ncbi:hypothetical protein V1477_006596 [Vespula maculifrons]|uniref:Uncharacterized protein n=1 Tax=Vespula maculifrons TaxID=7453 RepID=A0ABD2CJA7_VESMC